MFSDSLGGKNSEGDILALRKLSALLESKQRRRAIFVLLLMLVGVFFEMVSLGLVLPVIGVMASPELIEGYPLVHKSFAVFGKLDHTQLVMVGMLILAVGYMMKNAYLAVLAWIQSSFIFSLHANLSQRLFANYLRQPYVFHLQHNSAQLIRNVTTEVNLFTNAAQSFMMLSTELLVLAGVSLLLIYFEPKGTLIVVAVLGLAAVFFYAVVRTRLTHWGKERRYHDGKRIQLVQEGLGSIKDIKLLAREESFLAQYHIHNFSNARVLQHQYFLQQIPRLWLEVLAVSGLATVVLVMVGQGKSMADFLPTLGLFGAAAFRLMPSVNRCLNSIQSTRFAIASINALHHELVETSQYATQSGATEMHRPFGGQIVLTNICFQYPGAERPALQDINLAIPCGTSIGFVGESGAGKSTLVDVILGLVAPSKGTVSVEGRDIHDKLRSWQGQIGYVPQSIYLTDDTLRRNVAFGLADHDIDDAAVWRALRAAQLDEFVRSLPQGVDTTVGERGVRLSGGQRQRIGIARALYHDPAVLVLDEATSSLDTATENGVMDAVRAMKGKKTILIITHRLSTVEQCDRLVRLDTGRIVEETDRRPFRPRMGDVDCLRSRAECPDETKHMNGSEAPMPPTACNAAAYLAVRD